MAKKDLAAFLLRLATDPKLNARYTKDPDGVASAAGLSPADRAALRGGVAATLESYLGEKPAAIVKTPIVKGSATTTRIVKQPIVKTAVKRKAATTRIVKAAIVKTPIVKAGVKTAIVKTAIVKTAIVKTSIVKTTKPGKGKPKKK